METRLAGGWQRVLARAAALGWAEAHHFERAHDLPVVQEQPASTARAAEPAVAGQPGPAAFRGRIEIIQGDLLAVLGLQVPRYEPAEIAFHVDTKHHRVSP